MQNPFELIDQRLKNIESILEQVLDNQNAILGKVERAKSHIKINEAAELLQMSKSTIYQMTMRKTIPYIKHYSRIYFKREDLIAWLEAS